MSVNGYRPGLNVRLDWWARSRGGRLKIGIERNGDGRAFVTASVAEHTGKGRNSSDALNELADQLVSEGWADDRASAGRVAV